MGSLARAATDSAVGRHIRLGVLIMMLRKAREFTKKVLGVSHSKSSLAGPVKSHQSSAVAWAG